jgi:hypothetical protein
LLPRLSLTTREAGGTSYLAEFAFDHFFTAAAGPVCGRSC